MDAIDDIDLSVDGVPSLVLRDLSEYATLPFIAAFDIPNINDQTQASAGSKQARPSQKRITYIALAKKTMPKLVDLYLRFKESPEIYNDGTLEAIFSVSMHAMMIRVFCSTSV